MLIKSMLLTLVIGILSGCAGIGDVVESGTQVSQSMGYNPKQLGKAIKDALLLSATRASDKLSADGAYQQHDRYFIGLPESLQTIRPALKTFGLDGALSDVEQAMNRAAELAASEAKFALTEAVGAMDITDAIGIVKGSDTAATDYFRTATRDALTVRYRGIVQQQLQKVSFYPTYQSLLKTYNKVPIANKPPLDLEERAVQKGLDALYQQIAVEEQNIRANPLEQGTVLISAVFAK